MSEIIILRAKFTSDEMMKNIIKLKSLENALYQDMLMLTNLNHEIYKKIDNCNYEISNFGNVKNMKTGKILKPALDRDGYYVISLYKNRKCKTSRIHRLVALFFIPNPENKQFVDHINNNITNNSLINLRWATGQQNQMNRTLNKNNKSGVKGVYFHKQNNKWEANIKLNGKLIYLGQFTNIEDAKKARKLKAIELFKEYINNCEL